MFPMILVTDKSIRIIFISVVVFQVVMVLKMLTIVGRVEM